MKTGSRIVVGIVSTLLAMAIAAYLVVRLLAGSEVTLPLTGGAAGAPSSAAVPSGSPALKTIHYRYSRFSRVSAGGAWDLTLRRGDGYAVTVEAPEGLVSRLSVLVHGSTLDLGLKPGATRVGRPIRAQVTMPTLEGLVLAGANRASFSGFSGERLSLECSGAASVSGGKGEYRHLRVVGSGASSILLRSLASVDAVVDLSGAGEAELEMKGGSLSGRVSGAARLRYWGNASSEKVETSGVGSVSHG